MSKRTGQARTGRSQTRAKTKPPLSGNQFQTFGCQASMLQSELSKVLDMSSFRDSYLMTSLLSKLGTSSVPEEERKQRAVEAWYADECHNRKTTKRLADFFECQRGFAPEASDQKILGVSRMALLNEAASIISSMLPKWSHSFYERSAFTNGSAVGYTKECGDPWFKYDGILTATPLAMSRVIALVASSPVWREHLSIRYGHYANAVRMVPGEHGFTVPKNSEIDRFCTQSPTGNMLLQKALGYQLREALRSVGIDLNDQSKNRNAARRASIHGRDATIDEKSASNSATCMLVTVLFPPDWVNELMVARSPVCQPRPGDPWVKTDMIGAMGNGYTFELESMIFYALAEACRRLTRSRGRTLVFGDDIITPVRCVHHVIGLLAFCGFRTNQSKSFWKGKFRESCGGHYLDGMDVTPIYIRKPVNDTTRMIWFLNKLRAWAGQSFDGDGPADERVWPLYKRLRRKYVCATLWGGVRSNSITSLWTPGPKRMRLVYDVDRKRLVGRPALLRTFQYMSPESAFLIDRFAKFHGDIQAYYEVFGSLPITSSMECLTGVSKSPVSVQDNKELFDDPLPLFADECVLGSRL